MHRHYSFIPKEKASAVDGTNVLTVVTVVVVRVGIARIEVEVATVSGIARIKRRRPVVAVRALIVERSAIPVARGGQEYQLAATVCWYGWKTEFRFYCRAKGWKAIDHASNFLIRTTRGGQKRPTVCEFTNSSLLACILYGVSQRVRRKTSYQPCQASLHVSKEKHALERRLALNGIGHDALHDAGQCDMTLSWGVLCVSAVGVAFLLAVHGQGDRLFPALIVSLHRLKGVRKQLFRQQQLQVLIVNGRLLHTLRQPLGKAGVRKTNVGNRGINTFELPLIHLELVQIAAGQPGAPVVGTQEGAFAVEMQLVADA